MRYDALSHAVLLTLFLGVAAHTDVISKSYVIKWDLIHELTNHFHCLAYLHFPGIGAERKMSLLVYRINN